MVDSPALVLRYSAPRLRRPKGRGAGQYAPRFLAELGDSREKFAEENRTLARRVQDDVVAELKAGTKRKSVSTGRLIAATASPENIFASAQVWGVGVPSFLDRSQAKYWRTIDEGSAAVWSHPFVGMTFYVNRRRAWGGSIAGMNSNGAVAGAPWSRSGAGRDDKFNPLSNAIAESVISKNGKRPRWLSTVTIKNEIEAQNYYHRGFERSGGIIQALRVYRSRLDRIVRAE